MQVVAFSTPPSRVWRWRIVNYSGETVEESRETFPAIAPAVAGGGRRLVEMAIDDRAATVRSHRSTSYLRGR